MEANARESNMPSLPDLWEEWAPRARAYLRAFPAFTAEDREDLAAEAISKAWFNRDRFDPVRPFAPWFFTILRRLALDTLAKSRETPRAPESLDGADVRSQSAEEVLIKSAEEALVQAFVASLSGRDRELASLVYGQGLGVGQAAAILKMPSGSAKWRLHEIRRALRRAWEREYGQTC